MENEIIAEKWKDVNNYEGYYQISNMGRVKSLSRKVPHPQSKILTIREEILEQTSRKNQAKIIMLSKDNIKKIYKIHILVAEHWLIKELHKNDVNHKNGIKNDNRVENLEWINKLENLIDEEWRDIKGYEGFYQVSNLGRVKSLQRIVSHGVMQKRTVKEKIFRQPNKNKYVLLSLTKEGDSKGYLIHRLVAEAFIPNPENKPKVNHKNFIRNDNRVKNLEWDTQLENIEHAIKGGRIVRGESRANSKLTEEQVKMIRNLYNIDKMRLKDLAEIYKVTSHTIHEIVNRKIWKHI